MPDVRPNAADRLVADDLAGRVLAQRYRIRHVIGTGASGKVYEADDIQLKRRVAVKVLHQALADDRGFLQRFRAEAQVAASLHHPNILTVHDWGEDHTAFMVMELLDGGSLRAMLDEGTRLDPSQAARLGRDLVGALEYAHARGIVHRDIKPANLLFDEHAVARIADFGLARALAEASWTEPAGAVFGTARYASPEQARGVTLDARSDLYSLALVLYEAITGTIPFVSDTVMGSLALRTQQSVTAPVEWGPLRAVIERAGRVEPDERYPNAATMAAALRDACEVLGRPEPLRLAGTRTSAAITDPNPTQAIAPATPGRVIDLREVGARTVFDQDAGIAPSDGIRGSSGDSPALFDQDAVPDEPVVVDALNAARRETATRRRARRSGRAVSFVVAFIVVVAIVGAVVALGSVTGGSSVAMPGVVGMSETEARARADNVGVDLKIDERDSDDPAGIVIAQQPAAGVRSDGALTIVVSRGPPPVQAPNLVKLDRAAAELAATDAGLVPEFDAVFSETVREGRVVGQTPGAGADAERDSVITVTLSKGPAPRAIPELSSDPTEARATLEGLGFVVKESKAFSDDVDDGDVVGTSPPIGTEVDYRGSIELIVSKGPKLVKVPSVFGLGFNEACARIDDTGLRCDTVGYSPGATVQNMDPQPGERLRRGDSVTLYF
jgi:serine/threonine-protein kinase